MVRRASRQQTGAWNRGQVNHRRQHRQQDRSSTAKAARLSLSHTHLLLLWLVLVRVLLWLVLVLLLVLLLLLLLLVHLEPCDHAQGRVCRGGLWRATQQPTGPWGAGGKAEGQGVAVGGGGWSHLGLCREHVSATPGRRQRLVLHHLPSHRRDGS